MLTLEQCQADLARKKVALENLEEAQKSEVSRLEEKVTSLRDENQGLKDALQGRNMDSSRDIALKDQTISFLEHKLADQQSISEKRQRELEDQLDSIKQERATQIAELSKTFQEQKQDLETKFDSRRKALKALQAEHNVKVPELERQTTLLNNQLIEARLKCEELKADLQANTDKQNS